jgi:high affinity Mn2+ porin
MFTTPPRIHLQCTLFTLLNLFLFPFASLSAQEKEYKDSHWSFHFQQTLVVQGHPSFSAPYSGRNSLSDQDESHTSLTSTFYFGRRLWPGAELYFNPEVAGGSGLSSTTGVAGFPNGEIYRIDQLKPQLYVARAFLRQIFSLSDKMEDVDDGQNTIAGKQPADRIALTLGKISLLDFFDDNTYSHEPRSSFLNWALMGNGAWDYPADTRGYTWALLAEYIRPTFAVRFATAMLPTYANGPTFDSNVANAHGEALEFEFKNVLSSTANAIRLFFYRNTARMGNYREAISSSTPPDITTNDRYGRTKYGVGINVGQLVTADLGVFARLGWNDGQNETWAFTEIDRTISGGGLLNCRFLDRPADKLGLAFELNGLSSAHRDYLSAGGYGFIIGDGKLRYGSEIIIETFYLAQVTKELALSIDYQFVANPAYNQDRGPVHIFAARSHIEF